MTGKKKGRGEDYRDWRRKKNKKGRELTEKKGVAEKERRKERERRKKVIKQERQERKSKRKREEMNFFFSIFIHTVPKMEQYCSCVVIKIITFGTPHERGFLVFGVPNGKYLAFGTPDGNALSNAQSFMVMRINLFTCNCQGP